MNNKIEAIFCGKNYENFEIIKRIKINNPDKTTIGKFLMSDTISKLLSLGNTSAIIPIKNNDNVVKKFIRKSLINVKPGTLINKLFYKNNFWILCENYDTYYAVMALTIRSLEKFEIFDDVSLNSVTTLMTIILINKINKILNNFINYILFKMI